MFKVGDNVICIDAQFRDDSSINGKLKFGEKYTIYDIDISAIIYTGYSYLTFEEIPFIGFNENRFIEQKEYRKQKLNKLCSK